MQKRDMDRKRLFRQEPSLHKTEFIIVGAYRIQLARDGEMCSVPKTNPIKTDAEC